MSRKNYEKFPLSLALFDALPVIFFSTAMLIIAVNYKNILFIIGAMLCTLAGVCKVIWKIIIAGTRKDIALLNRQLRVTMPKYLFIASSVAVVPPLLATATVAAGLNLNTL